MKLINKSLAHKFLILLLVIYFVFGTALLVLRYWVPHKINDWRPQIESQLAKTLNLDVSLDTINLRWYGWQPSLSIKNASLKNAQTKLQIPALNIDLNWSALFNQYSGLLRLHVKGMDLSIVRTTRTQINILGYDIDLEGDNFDMDWLITLLNQPYISFTNSIIRWQDTYRSAPELRLENVNAAIEHDSNDGLGLFIDAVVPQTSMAKLQLKLHLDKQDLQQSIENLKDFEAWLAISNFKFADWHTWLDVPTGISNNNSNLQAWLNTKSKQRQLIALANGSDFVYQPNIARNIKLADFNLWLANDLSDIDLSAVDNSADLLKNLQFDLSVNDLYLFETETFTYPIDIQSLKSTGVIEHTDNLKITIEQLLLANQDIKFNASGSWENGESAGYSDFKGEIERANLAAIYKYLPKQVDRDAHDWLKHGLISADLAGGQFYLQGDVNEFPFGLNPGAGDFMVAGNFTNGQIEFVPDALPAEKWPQLYDLNGYAKLHRASLELQSDRALMSPIKDSVIELTKLKANIPDIEYDSILSVTGQSKASGKSYMDLLKNTPLAAMLGGIFDEATASGQWQVPLSLVVPLAHSIDTQVQGSVDLTDGELQFYDVAPRFTKLNGSVNFTEHGVFIDQAVTASFLGGGLKLNGSLGGAKATGLKAHGVITAKALADYVGTYGMRRIQGSLNYAASLKQQGNAYIISMSSDTEQLELDLPAPFSKPSGEKRNLNITWTDAPKPNESLKINYGDVVKLDLLHTAGAQQGPYFHSAALGIQRAANIEIPNGLSIDIDYPLIDLDQWDDITSEFDKPVKAQQKTTNTRQIWPDLKLFAIQADQLRTLGTRLDRAVIRAQKKNNTNWSLTVTSDQTNGNVKWQVKDEQLIGTVKASFDQLSLGDDPDDNNALLPESDDIERQINENINIPAMVIEANNLMIFGRSFGKLNIEGTRDAKNKLWTLDRLRLGNDDTAMLKGTGTWYLTGPQRGLQINADVVLNDLGQWMANAGWTEILAGGSGDLKGKFIWHNLPWDTSINDLSGELKAEIKNGRFIKVNSSSAKLLEVLSLQSIMRLNKLEKGLMDLTEGGFPFDELQGHMQLDRGDVDIVDYKITGPVATILLQGKVNIMRRDMDLDAVVVPNIDVSGAAVAAGIAINPLVGLGAFVTQWLLKGPLAKSMTARYHVGGSWDDPKMTEVPVEQ